jgi:hypothetical protein
MEQIIITKTKRAYKCKICGERINEYVLDNGKRYHLKCYDVKLEKDKENLEWIDLYEYVKKHIMQYSEVMKLDNKMVLRLKGLKEGNFVSNKNLKKHANYSYKSILYTFMAKKIDILNLTSTSSFKDEHHKFNTVMKIIEYNLNDTVMRMERNIKTEEKVSDLDLEDIYNGNTQEYKKNDKSNTVSEKLKNIW